MPFTFIQVEERKTRVIWLVFAVVILFYFLTAYLLLLIFDVVVVGRSALLEQSFWPSGSQTLIALGAAFLIAAIHGAVSMSNLIAKMSLAVGAEPCDEKDVYHHNFKNIVDEVSVAIGGRPLTPLVIPTVACNAFALEDFSGRAVIGVTEGLLTRLNRPQLEAVVGHEAGHIVNGDCLSTSVTCSLAEIYDEAVSKLSTGVRNVRGRAGLLILLVYLVLGGMRFLSALMRYFISRQKEYRADATSVRLTRDPLSLAEALALISRNWRGSGADGERLESIFIVNPNNRAVDETNGALADLFSTHPPINDRIKVLTGMAHLDAATLEEKLKNYQWVSPVAKPEVSAAPLPVSDKKWFVFDEQQQWQGPYALAQLSALGTLTPDAWIRADGEEGARHAYEDSDLMRLFGGAPKEGGQEPRACPRCHTPLNEIVYEGAPALKCPYCEGVFLENERVSRVLFRTDQVFSDDIVRRAELAMKQRKLKDNERAGRIFFIDNKLLSADAGSPAEAPIEQNKAMGERQQRPQADNPFELACPKCQSRMRRQFFVYSYPVEIDRCIECDGVWFDKDELEVLQYIYEHKEKFFDEGPSQGAFS